MVQECAKAHQTAQLLTCKNHRTFDDEIGFQVLGEVVGIISLDDFPRPVRKLIKPQSAVFSQGALGLPYEQIATVVEMHNLHIASSDALSQPFKVSPGEQPFVIKLEPLLGPLRQIQPMRPDVDVAADRLQKIEYAAGLSQALGLLTDLAERKSQNRVPGFKRFEKYRGRVWTKHPHGGADSSGRLGDMMEYSAADDGISEPALEIISLRIDSDRQATIDQISFRRFPIIDRFG
jgi:hypothetical protein